MLNTLKAVIIDDEAHCIDHLKNCIEQYCPIITQVNSYKSINEGLKELISSPPDLVFLDVEMPEGTGFDLLSYFDHPGFKIIFTTAHIQYAVKAVSTEAIDYLLKPIQPDELKKCIDGFIKTSNEINPKKTTDNPKKIPLSSQDKIIFCNPKDIIRCEADGAYTKVFLNSKTYTISKNIKMMGAVLEPYNFFRVHRSHIINLGHVLQYIKGDGGQVIMSDGSYVDVSRSKREEFLSVMF